MTLLVDPAPVEADRFEAMRHAMVVSQLRTNAVTDVRVIDAMSQIARENYLPAEQRSLAYTDKLLPLGKGRSQNLPLATARLLNQAEVLPTDRVLLIGAAGGYTAAVLATMATSVVALEEDAALVALAKPVLSSHANVTLVEGALAAGHAEAGPYDLIVIDGAVEDLPEAIVASLAPNGRLVTGTVDRGVTRLSIGRGTEGGFGLVNFLDIECAVLPTFVRVPSFQF